MPEPQVVTIGFFTSIPAAVNSAVSSSADFNVPSVANTDDPGMLTAPGM